MVRRTHHVASRHVASPHVASPRPNPLSPPWRPNQPPRPLLRAASLFTAAVSIVSLYACLLLTPSLILVRQKPPSLTRSLMPTSRPPNGMRGGEREEEGEEEFAEMGEGDEELVEIDSGDEDVLSADFDDDDAPAELADDGMGGEEGEEGEGGQDDSVHVFTAHTGSVYAVACSPLPGGRVASGGGDDVAYLWTIGQAEDPIKLEGHRDSIAAVEFSGDGRWVATAGMDGVVMLWDAATGDRRHRLEGPGEAIEFLTWHPRGAVVLAGSEDLTAWMWNAETGACMAVFTGHSAGVTCGAFSPDGGSPVGPSPPMGGRCGRGQRTGRCAARTRALPPPPPPSQAHCSTATPSHVWPWRLRAQWALLAPPTTPPPSSACSNPRCWGCWRGTRTRWRRWSSTP
ncbi:unnamed protein product, partial [Closterium sp. Naga37s-1]